MNEEQKRRFEAIWNEYEADQRETARKLSALEMELDDIPALQLIREFQRRVVRLGLQMADETAPTAKGDA